MRNFIRFNLFVLFVCLFTSASFADKQINVFSGFAGHQKMSNAVAVSQDNSELIFDARGNKYQNLLKLCNGALEPNTKYLIEFDYDANSLEKDSANKAFIFVYVRNQKYIKQVRDRASGRAVPAEKTSKFTLNFKTDRFANEYAICIDAFGKINASVRNFKLYKLENDEEFFPITENPQSFDMKKLGKLPTGSQEFEVLLPNPKNQIVVNAADFGLNEQIENSASVINLAIDHCKKIGATKLILPKGTYKIFEEVEIKIDGLKDFTFDGNGSTLVYKKRKARNAVVQNCERVLICNINMDWDWKTDPLASLVEIVGIEKNKEDGYVDFKFLEHTDFPNKNVRVAYISGYDMQAKAVGFENCYCRGFEMHRGRSPKPKTQWLSGNVLRLFAPSIDIRAIEKGTFYRMQHSYYEMGGIALIANTHTTLKNFNIWSCSGQAIVLGKTQQYTHLNKVNVTIPKGVNRIISSTADHFILGQSRGFIILDECDFGFGADDCINIHDNSVFMYKNSENSLRSISQRNSHLWQVGETFEFRNGDLSPTGVNAKVIQIRNLDKKLGIDEVIFDKPVPNVKIDGFVLFNHKYGTRNVIIRNCFFHENRARGILVLAKDVTIENCRFKHNEMGAMKIETGYTLRLWCEGYGVDNLLVKNCVFETSNSYGYKTSGKERDIYIGTYLKTDPSELHYDYPILTNILFEGNTFKDTFGYIAYISSAKNVTFANNTIINTKPRNNPLPYRGSFYAGWASNINIVNNTYIDSTCVKNAGVYVVRNTVKNLVIAGNKVEKSN